MKVLVDHQIFVAQKFGGISRYFNELADTDIYEISNVNQRFLEQEQSAPVASNKLLHRGIRYVKRRLNSSSPAPEVDAIQLKAIAEIVNSDYDVFHPTYYDTYFLDIIKKPFVLTVYDLIHEIYSEYFNLADSVIQNKRILCQKADKVIAISEQTKKDLIDIFDLPPNKISVTHLASDFATIIPDKQNLKINTSNYILFIGNRGIYKNFYFFAQSISILLKSDSSLMLLCTGHPFTKQEYNFFAELGIGKQVTHVYPQDDCELAWLYANAKLFAFPSLYEGFGLPLLEAFACSCPVVSSNGGSLPEVGGNGALYFEPKNTRQIQEAVSTALYDEKVREKLISNGQKRFAEFSWDKCRAETLAVYRSV